MRIELIHPMLVHFPLALLGVGSFLRAIAIYERRVLLTSWIVVGIGVCMAWMTVLAGEFAASVVQSSLCDPSVLARHSLFAYSAAYLFSGALLFDWARAYWGLSSFWGKINFVIYLAGVAVLGYVGFLGGNLVYEQGAAVHKCKVITPAK